MSRLIVVFDLDDTLYPERDFAHAGFEAAGRFAEERWGIAGLGDEMKRLFAAGHLGKLFGTALRTHLPEAGDEDVQALHRAYRNAEPTLSLFDDGAFALDHFGARGPIGLITDGTLAMQQRKVAGLAIAHRFQSIVFTDALGEGRAYFKPHPRSYEAMAAALGREGDRFAYVGDNPAKDFLAPNAMGWTSVQVVREGGIHDPHRRLPGGEPQHRISSLRELPGVLGTG
jgi:putative hydrolase of the HAD superfamily